MSHTLAFDVYGTLIDTAGVVAALSLQLGDRAADFARLWREKQLEYSFRRALMHHYAGGFAQCTREALDYACAAHRFELDADTRDALLDGYRRLPPFPEVSGALASLRDAGHRLYAFSNGHPDDLEALLDQAGLRSVFVDVVSVHAVQSFKPDRAVYTHFLACSGASAADTWLVSGNAFDVLGAAAVGWRTIWVRRSAEQIFDPWGTMPTAAVASLDGIAAALGAN
jgi:2-haloacid dehalogenase